jgi:hypothetical protein
MFPRRSDALPGRPLRPEAGLWAALWFGIGMLAVVNLATATNILVFQRMLPRQAAYPGILRAAEPPVVVALPSDAPLERATVRPGELVMAGGVVATLDIAAMAARRRELEGRIAADTELRRCLLGLGPGAAGRAAVPRAPDRRGPDAAADIVAALQECRADLDAEVEAAARVELARRTAADDLAVTQRELDLAMAAEGDPRPRSTRLAEILSLTRRRDQLIAREALVRLDGLRLAIEQRRSRTERVRGLSDTIAAAQAALAALDRHLSAPALVAPRAGRVVKVRTMPARESFPEPVPLIEIDPEGGSGDVWQLSVPQESVSSLLGSGAVELVLADHTGQKVRLVGHPTVPDASDTEAGTVVPPVADETRATSDILIELDADSARALQEDAGLRQLSQSGVAAEILVGQGAQPVHTLLARLWAAAGPSL